MGNPVRDQACPDARVEDRQENVGEDEAHDERAQRLFKGRQHQARHPSKLQVLVSVQGRIASGPMISGGGLKSRAAPRIAFAGRRKPLRRR